MAELKVEADAREVGFDTARLQRIDAHFARYVDDGRLPGWLILVSRAGRIAHLSTYGWRDMEVQAPLTPDTLFRIYSMTKPIRIEHLQNCVEWWGGAAREGRVETPQAWKVTADEVKARGYNLDIKNPHTVADDHGDPETLLAELQVADQRAQDLREQLKAILAEALLR